MLGWTIPPMDIAKTRFAAFEVDAAAGQLRKHGVKIRLQEQPFRILTYLLERPGELVTREELRERIWGSDTFVDFDHGLNAAVNRLRTALDDSAATPRYIETVARKGYRFIGTIETPSPTLPLPVEHPVRRTPLWIFATAACALLAIGAWRWQPQFREMRLDTVTMLTGSESMPSLSPDGKQVAFVWNGEREKNAEIYVKMIGSEAMLRLTDDPGADLLPSWSPDGRSIAFVRLRGKVGIHVVSPLGGPARQVIEFPGIDRRPGGPETRIVRDLLYSITNRPSWTPDSKFLAVTRMSEPPEPDDGAVWLVGVETAGVRTLLAPSDDGFYKHAAISPNGRELAVVRCSKPSNTAPKCDLRVFPLSAAFEIAGESVVVLKDAGLMRGLAWMPDGEGLIVSGFRLPRYYLWRVPIKPGAEPQRIELSGNDAIWPSIAAGDGKLAYARSILQPDLWKLTIGGTNAPFLSSTARDTSPVLSPDGKRVVFQSARGGANDIWVAGIDGSDLRQLSNKLGKECVSPSWSPDGKFVAFASLHADDSKHVWIVDSNGGPPRQLTHGASGNDHPEWSRDGKAIYFMSNRSGRPETWRMPAGGGDSVQITTNGAEDAFESFDGKSLIFSKGAEGVGGIYSMPIKGGPEKHIITVPLIRGSFQVANDGIYYITGRDEELCDLRFYEMATGRTSVVTTLERPVAFGISTTPDRKTFVYSRTVTGGDLMLIDNFR